MCAENTKKVEKKKRIFLPVLAGILLVIAAMVAAIPFVLSMDFVRQLVVEKVNAAGVGTLGIDSMYFSWFSGNGLKGLSFSDKLGHQVKVREIKVSEGLAGMIGREINFGTITVSSPEISIITIKTEPVSESHGKGEEAAATGKPVAKTGDGQPQPGQPPKLLSLPVDVAGMIKVENGTASVQEPGGGRKHEFEKINCVIGVTSLNKPVTVDAGLAQVGGGALHISGSVKVLENGVFDPGKIAADISVQAASVDLEPFGLMAASLAPVPAVKGSLDTTLSIKVKGLGCISADGSVTLPRLQLSGGSLGADHPDLNSSCLKFSVVVENKNINIKTFDLRTPFLVAAVSGVLVDKGGKYPEGNIVLDARLDIPDLAHEMPATLHIEKGVVITRGEVTVRGEVSSTSNGLACAADVKLADVEAKADGKVMALSHPVQLQSKIVMTAEGTRIEKCLLSSSFANLSGRGDLKDLQVTFNADIALAMDEARKFIALGKVSAGGKISGVSRILSTSATERKVATRVTVDELNVAGVGPNPFEMDTARAGLDMVVKTTPDGKVMEISGTRLTIDSAPVNVKLDVAGIVPGTRLEDMEITGLAVKAKADVRKIFAMGLGMGVIPAGSDGSGAFDVTIGGKMNKGLLTLDPVTVEITNLKLSVKDKKLSEPRVAVKCTVEADIAKHDLKLIGLNNTMTAGVVDVPLLSVTDWTSKVPMVTGAGTAKISIGKLFEQMGDFMGMPPGSSVSGDLGCAFSVSQSKHAQALSLDAVIKDLGIKQAAVPAFAEPAVKLVLNAEQDVTSGDIAVKSLNLESSILALAAQGSLSDVRRENVLLLDGVQTCDFKRIGEIVTAFGGKPVEMEGRQEKKFHIRTALAGPGWKNMLRKTEANVSLYLGKLKAFGLQVEGLNFSALAGDGSVGADISTRVNEGDLKMKPEVNAARDDVFLSIPDGSCVLKNVKITDDMMTDLIAKIHPLLKGCAVTSGKADLVLNKCYVPLDPKMKNKISVEGNLVLTNLVVEPGGTLKDLLSLTGQELKPLTVPHAMISFVCKDGKLTPSPLTIGNSDYSMTLTGFVTLDGMMKFVASVPVTARMTGKKVGQYVKDVVVEVPIEGPVAKPVISGDAIKAAAEKVVEGAAGKLIKEEGAKFLNDLFNKKKDDKPRK